MICSRNAWAMLGSTSTKGNYLMKFSKLFMAGLTQHSPLHRPTPMSRWKIARPAPDRITRRCSPCRMAAPAPPTVKIRVQIPEGVIAVKPMPKPGWSVETVKGKYAASYELHGATIAEGVKEVTWSGGKLADDNYDEFVVRRLSHRKPQAEHHAVFSGGAGMRTGDQPLDRYPRRRTRPRMGMTASRRRRASN